ncbi:hypothetical protein HNQ77_003812 [Silvibacterium bohemicum]|uniref:Uncharacterized protein n=1 Tax=Silvibacterium bohemicum TaxID=1577686 RepID=A0A841JWU6_9BACT|nr:hypothetical protein [Silvibacterium bohemicum]MBB6145842.1 hypothetical protein [Silvibacterium bohemicum]
MHRFSFYVPLALPTLTSLHAQVHYDPSPNAMVELAGDYLHFAADSATTEAANHLGGAPCSVLNSINLPGFH